MVAVHGFVAAPGRCAWITSTSAGKQFLANKQRDHAAMAKKGQYLCHLQAHSAHQHLRVRAQLAAQLAHRALHYDVPVLAEVRATQAPQSASHLEPLACYVSYRNNALLQILIDKCSFLLQRRQRIADTAVTRLQNGTIEPT